MAANLNPRLESLVSLFQDIGTLCTFQQNDVQALNHFLLCKYVREQNGWSTPNVVENAIQKHNIQTNHPKLYRKHIQNVKILEQYTRRFHYAMTQNHKRNIKSAIVGKVSLGIPDRPFCFINTPDKMAVFCFKSDLRAIFLM